LQGAENEEARGVIASLLYVVVRRMLTLLTLRFRSDASKDLEIVVPFATN